MPADIFVTVEDITTQLESYNYLRVYRAGTLTGAYTLIDTQLLVAGQYHYTYYDSGGSANAWYKFTLYQSVGNTESSPSDIFRPFGTTRQRIRQRALSEYRAGLVIIAAAAGSTIALWKTADPRVASAIHKAGKFVGSWLMPSNTSGGIIDGAARFITANATPTDGELTVDAWSDPPAAGDEAELHWLASPDEWNAALNRALGRYYYIDRLPLVGLGGSTYEYDLSKFPWLKKGNLHSVWYYPTGSSIESPWVGDGRWYKVRDDRDILTLAISPAIDTSETLYLECSRPMLPLYTDAAQPPSICNEDLISALTYDEILATLARPGAGASQDRKAWQRARIFHSRKLGNLLRIHRPRPRHSVPMPATPFEVPQPFSAR